MQIVFVEPASKLDELSEKFHFEKSDVVSLSDRSVILSAACTYIQVSHPVLSTLYACMVQA